MDRIRSATRGQPPDVPDGKRDTAVLWAAALGLQAVTADVEGGAPSS